MVQRVQHRELTVGDTGALQSLSDRDTDCVGRAEKLEKEIETRTQELDMLKKQLVENEYSFARGGKSFAVGKPDNFNLDNSSIEKKQDDDNDFTNVADEMLQSKVKKLE